MNILLADDHALVRDALVRTVESLGTDIRTFEAADFDSVLRLVAEHAIDLAVVDLNMPGPPGIEGLCLLRRRFPTLALVAISAQDDAATINQVLACGVSGFIPKTHAGDVVRQALRLILAGGTYVPQQALGAAATPAKPGAPRLTPRQRHVLCRLLHGRSNKLIARDLALTEGTVKTHVAAILRELGARNRTEAVVRAHALGLQGDPASIAS